MKYMKYYPSVNRMLKSMNKISFKYYIHVRMAFKILRLIEYWGTVRLNIEAQSAIHGFVRHFIIFPINGAKIQIFSEEYRYEYTQN